MKKHISFVDSAKRFDRIACSLLWGILLKIGIIKHMVQNVQAIYDGTKIVVDTGEGLMLIWVLDRDVTCLQHREEHCHPWLR